MASLPLVSLSSRLLMVLALVGIAGGFHLTGIAANAHAPLAAVTGLEVVGELRPGTPNLPLLLVVQWDEVEGADRYELERADTPPPAAERAYEPVATLTGADRRPNGKIGYVDEAGFAFAGGDCFRVRALRGTEVGEWAETCLPIPPSDGPGPPEPADIDFQVELTPDYEFTLISWNLLPGLLGPSELWNADVGSPLIVVPAAAQPGRIQLVLPRFGGCFRLIVGGSPPIDHPCTGLPTDLPPPRLMQSLGDITRFTITGAGTLAVVVVWPQTGGPETVFKVERIGGPGSGEIATVAARAASFQGFESDVMVFLDPAPTGHHCYRVTATSYTERWVVGESCQSDPIPPDTGTGFRATDRPGPRLVVASIVLLAAAALASIRFRSPPA